MEEVSIMPKHEMPEQKTIKSSAPPRPNAALVTMQIDAMQEVLRRMQASRTVRLDPITNEKLGKIPQH